MQLEGTFNRAHSSAEAQHEFQLMNLTRHVLRYYKGMKTFGALCNYWHFKLAYVFAANHFSPFKYKCRSFNCDALLLSVSGFICHEGHKGLHWISVMPVATPISIQIPNIYILCSLMGFKKHYSQQKSYSNLLYYYKALKTAWKHRFNGMYVDEVTDSGHRGAVYHRRCTKGSTAAFWR